MFRKLVSSLPFSPALVGQLGFYVRRLRKEEVTRKLGLVFTALAVAMQSFATFSPPEHALADNRPDIIPGGVTSMQQVLNTYDASVKGQNDFKDLMDYLGITRDELARTPNNVVYVCSTDDNKSIVSFGRRQNYSEAEGSLKHNVVRSDGGVSVFYSVPLYRFDSVHNRPMNCYDSYVGKSEKIGWFAIMRKCGNIQVKKNVQKFPKGHFVSATCDSVKGYAYDERQTNQPVKVYLFFGGPPGKGKQYGPINANQATPTSPAGGSHGFSFAVGDEYKRPNTPTDVWATFQPLPGWKEPTVQFDNQVTIPGNCAPKNDPVASCSDLDAIQISRTQVKLIAKSTTDQGVSVKGYTFTVTDPSGKKIYDKNITTTSTSITSEALTTNVAGKYEAKVVVHTTIGDKTSDDCATNFTVNPPDKCRFIGSGSINADDPNCKPCPYDNNIWVNDPECVVKISESKEARNLTKNLGKANGTLASATDRIEFTVRTTNLSDADTTIAINEDLADVLEYARLLDAGGGVLDQQTKVLSWNNVKLAAQKTDVRSFVVQLSDSIPSTARGENNPAAYDCVMTNSYGNTIEVKVDCPPVKDVESAVKTLPATGPGENIVFGTLLVMLVAYFYARSRQMGKEAQIIRKDYSSGAL